MSPGGASSTSGVRATRLSPDRAREVVEVFCDAFRAYPVMTYVIGPGHHDFDRRLQRLIELFVLRRLKYAFALGVSAGDELAGAATMTVPGEPPAPPEIVALNDAVWSDLGADACERYERYKAATQPLNDPRRHHHLNMIGVRHAHMGRGLARPLLDAVARFGEEDPDSAGVSLTTEVPRNVDLYRHFGFRVIGEARVAPGLETWSLFRERDR